MPSSNVRLPWPLTRAEPIYPDAPWGVFQGGLNERGLRQSCTGAIFWVDPNYTGVSDQRAGTSPEYPLRTITTALTKCTPYAGDMIVVMANDAWQYGQGVVRALPIAESVTVTVHGVKIVGMSPSGSLGVVWCPATNLGTCITVQAMDVLIEGFCFSANVGALTGANGIYALYGGAAFGDNLTVRNCFFDDAIDIAIQLEFSYNCEIAYNWFQECDLAGVYTDPAGLGIRNCHIHHNWLHEVGDGQIGALSLRVADLCKIDHNQIYNSNAQAGIAATDEGIDTTGGRENIVHHNVLSCLLPPVGPGDYADFCSGSATDAWVQNYCTNGPSTTTP